MRRPWPTRGSGAMEKRKVSKFVKIRPVVFEFKSRQTDI